MFVKHSVNDHGRVKEDCAGRVVGESEGGEQHLMGELQLFLPQLTRTAQLDLTVNS